MRVRLAPLGTSYRHRNRLRRLFRRLFRRRLRRHRLRRHRLRRQIIMWSRKNYLKKDLCGENPIFDKIPVKIPFFYKK